MCVDSRSPPSLEVRAEAIRCEREGFPGGARGRSVSVPLNLGIQFAVQSALRPVVNSPPVSELSEVRAVLKLQQEQLHQLTQSVARWQSSTRRSPSPYNSSIICRQCQQPGHFERESDGERVPARAPEPATAPSPFDRLFRPASGSGN